MYVRRREKELEVTGSCFKNYLIRKSVRNDHNIIKKFPKEHIIKMFKFGQKEVTTKDFYGRRQITDIFLIDVNKLLVSDRVPCNNGKDFWYIVGY